MATGIDHGRGIEAVQPAAQRVGDGQVGREHRARLLSDGKRVGGQPAVVAVLLQIEEELGPRPQVVRADAQIPVPARGRVAEMNVVRQPRVQDVGKGRGRQPTAGDGVADVERDADRPEADVVAQSNDFRWRIEQACRSPRLRRLVLQVQHDLRLIGGGTGNRLDQPARRAPVVDLKDGVVAVGERRTRNARRPEIARELLGFPQQIDGPSRTPASGDDSAPCSNARSPFRLTFTAATSRPRRARSSVIWVASRTSSGKITSTPSTPGTSLARCSLSPMGIACW